MIFHDLNFGSSVANILLDYGSPVSLLSSTWKLATLKFGFLMLYFFGEGGTGESDYLRICGGFLKLKSSVGTIFAVLGI